jgi:hypothetical protein
MKKNEALLDRFLRLLAAIVLIVLFFKLDVASPWNYIMLAVAIVFIATAVFGVCPIYTLFGIDTRQFKESDTKA